MPRKRRMEQLASHSCFHKAELSCPWSNVYQVRTFPLMLSFYALSHENSRLKQKEKKNVFQDSSLWVTKIKLYRTLKIYTGQLICGQNFHVLENSFKSIKEHKLTVFNCILTIWCTYLKTWKGSLFFTWNFSSLASDRFSSTISNGAGV